MMMAFILVCLGKENSTEVLQSHFQGILKLRDFIAARIQHKVSLHKLLCLAVYLENPEGFWEHSACHMFYVCLWQQAPVSQVTASSKETLVYQEPHKIHTSLILP